MTIARADEFIPYGAAVLVRGRRVGLAGTDLANGTALPEPYPDPSGGYSPGRSVPVQLFTDLGGRDLHALANGPVMDPVRIFLPAGKITEAEYRARERRNLNPECQNP